MKNLLGMLLRCLAASLLITPSIHAAAISGQGTWETTLQGRDLDGNLATFEAYFDTSLNITWLADANYAMTSGYDSDGRMIGSTANTWAEYEYLNPYGSGITGWRLPTTIDVGNDGLTYTNIYQGVDYGFNITSHSEMSHMFYVTLGNSALYSTSGTYNWRLCPEPYYCLTNTGVFSNLGPGNYWSSTHLATSTAYLWTFDFSNGFQGADYYYNQNYMAWAVHDGDVGAAVPEPETYVLMLAGLGLVGWAARQQRG